VGEVLLRALGYVLGATLFVGLVGLQWWLARGGSSILSSSAARREAWRRAARAVGLARVEESSGGLSGWAGRVRVTLSSLETGGVPATRLVLNGPGMADGLTIRPETLGTTLRAAVGEREIEIGDGAFDHAAWIQGSPALAHALLDPEARDALRSVFGGYLRLSGKMSFLASASFDDGALVIDVPAVLEGRGGAKGALAALVDALAGAERETARLGRPERLPEVLAAALELARRLAPPSDVARRIAENLRDEPEPGVRARSLTALVREFPKHPATREALLAAREDADAEVRLRAALALGDEGREVLLALAGGEGAEDATTARAVAALGARLDPAEARKLLGRALRTRRMATAQACMEILGHQRGPEAVAMLARVLAIEKGELAVAAAGALGTTHDPGAEAPLVRALDSPSGALRDAAARALGRAGTATAVPPLKAAEARYSDVTRTARQAIAEIQARLTGAEPGQLSLATAEGEAGRLSLADADPAGRLTLAGTSTGEPAAAGGARVAPGRPAPESTATPTETVGTPELQTETDPPRPPAPRPRERE
jgi:HEAT repeat protein